MQVKISKSFTVDAPPELGWRFLQNVPTVAGCMPGASVTEQIDDNNFKGQIKVRLGPIAMAFNGSFEVTELNHEQRSLSITGKGQDSKGSSSAQLDLTARIDSGDNENSFELKGDSTITITGKVASFGGRMMQQVGEQVLNQFGKNFTSSVTSLAGATEQEPESTTASNGPTPITAAAAELNGLSLGLKAALGYLKSIFNKG